LAGPDKVVDAAYGEAHEGANQRVNSALSMLAAWVSVTTIIIMEIEFDAAKNQRKANKREVRRYEQFR